MSSQRPARPQRKSVHPRLEELEPRLAPAVFNVNSISGLLSAIHTSDTNADASNTIVLAKGTYTLKGTATSEIVIQNQTTKTKSLTVEGNTEQNTIITGGSGWKDRIFAILGSGNLTVNLQNLSIKGGHVSSTKASVVAKGGGMLLDGDNVKLSNVAVLSNAAVGAVGANGAKGAAGKTGLNGGMGGAARGGGIYLASGELTLSNATISNNNAVGGKGGAGGAGGDIKTHYAPTAHFNGDGANGSTGKGTTLGGGGAGNNGGKGGDGKKGAQPASLKNDNGGNGGQGGEADGGGIYVASGQLTLNLQTAIASNSARGGSGGKGGAPGHHISSRSGAVQVQSKGFPGWAGGHGGTGANGINVGDLTGIVGGRGGQGGQGGAGGKGGDGASGGAGGKGGAGGNANGGGVYVASGTLSIVSANVSRNKATGGLGGIGANGGAGGHGGEGGSAGQGGGGGGGGTAVPFSNPNQGGTAGNGGTGGAGGNGGSGGNGGAGGVGGAGGTGGAGRGGGLYIAGGNITVILSTASSNIATGGVGGVGGAGGAAGPGGAGGAGGTHTDLVGGGMGGAGGNGIGFGLAGPGGNAGKAGKGGKGGVGGDPGTGGSGGDGLGGGIYLAAGKLTLVKSTFSNEAIGGKGGSGGAGGAGGDGQRGGTGGAGGQGGQGAAGGGGGSGGKGGTGGSGGAGGNGGRAGHGGHGGNGQGGDLFVATGDSAALSGNTLNGTAQGGHAGANGARGAGGKAGLGGAGGQGGPGSSGGAAGASGKAGKAGVTGTIGAASTPASNGTSAGNTVYGTTSSYTKPPTTNLNAPNVTKTNAGKLNPYTFTITYSDPVLIQGSSVSGAVVHVLPPSGSAITTKAIKTTLSGLQDGKGDAQTIAVTYQFTPPGGSWTTADDGTYTIKLVSSPPKDLAGNAAATGSVGTFTVNLTTQLQPVRPTSSSSPPSPSPSSSPPALSAPPLLVLVDQILAASEMVNAERTVTETPSLWGIPPLMSTFDSLGNLESVALLGIDVTILFELL